MRVQNLGYNLSVPWVWTAKYLDRKSPRPIFQAKKPNKYNFKRVHGWFCKKSAKMFNFEP